MAVGFRRSGLRATPQRLAVMEYVAHHPVHATADQVYRAINRRDPRASRATVYNCLHALVKAGLLRQVMLDGQAARFDANIGQHHHFVCGRCGAVEDIAPMKAPGFVAPAILDGRYVADYEVILHGVCESCRAREQRRNK
jgi:Fe2+ or Zn2+ uptake regulation protein